MKSIVDLVNLGAGQLFLYCDIPKADNVSLLFAVTPCSQDSDQDTCFLNSFTTAENYRSLDIDVKTGTEGCLMLIRPSACIVARFKTQRKPKSVSTEDRGQSNHFLVMKCLII